MFPFIPPENTGKPEISDVFKGYKKDKLGRNRWKDLIKAVRAITKYFWVARKNYEEKKGRVQLK